MLSVLAPAVVQVLHLATLLPPSVRRPRPFHAAA